MQGRNTSGISKVASCIRLPFKCNDHTECSNPDCVERVVAYLQNRIKDPCRVQYALVSLFVQEEMSGIDDG